MKKWFRNLAVLAAVLVAALVATALRDSQNNYIEAEVDDTPIEALDAQQVVPQSDFDDAAPDEPVAQQWPAPTADSVDAPDLSPAVELDRPARAVLPNRSKTLLIEGVGVRGGLRPTFTTEQIDPSWAGVTESQILNQLARQPDLVLRTLDVECRATVCRVQLTTPDGSIPSLRLEHFTDQSGSLESLVFFIDEDVNGISTATIFLKRDATSTTQAVSPDAIRAGA